LSRHSTRPTDAEPRRLPEVASLRDDRRQRRQGIVEAAERLMFEQDYEDIAVKDVATDAGVALGTLYRYFNSKDHLFACALLSWSRGFGDHLERSTPGPTVDQVRTIYRRAVRAFERTPRVYGVLIQVMSSRDPYAAEVFGEFSQRQTEAFGSALDTSGLDDRRREDIVAVMGAVLNENLGRWQRGLQPLPAVYRAIDRATGLIFDAEGAD
jgi:TetR/AcrR family transcriptional regulator, cholesterol catabolism regulator